MSKAENYYYHLLHKEEQAVYHALETGLRSNSPSIMVPKSDVRKLAEIYFMIRLDHPEIFYTVSYKARTWQGADSIEVMPEYLYPKKQIKAHQQAMDSRIEKLIRPAMKLKEEEKEQYIHDFICEHVHYDKLKKPYSHEIIGPLGHGIGVCEGIAKTVKILCDHLGIWCIIPISDNNPDKQIRYRHTWNILKLGGQYYHMDATFDLSLSKESLIRYDYYNLDDKNIFRDHEPVMYPMPACQDGKKRYYIQKKLSFTTYDEVRKRCAQSVKKGKDFLFHWRGGYLTKEVFLDLLKIMKEEAEKKEKHLCLSLNWAQAVIKADFKDEIEESIIMEQANEGEQ